MNFQVNFQVNLGDTKEDGGEVRRPLRTRRLLVTSDPPKEVWACGSDAYHHCNPCESPKIKNIIDIAFFWRISGSLTPDP